MLMDDRWTFVKQKPQKNKTKNDLRAPDGDRTRNHLMTGEAELDESPKIIHKTPIFKNCYLLRASSSYYYWFNKDS